MGKKKKAKAVETEAELNMTPMIDVTFQLLIFFLVTLKFKLLEKKLPSYLPTDFGTNAAPQIIDENWAIVKMVQPTKDDDPKRLIRRKTKFYFGEDKLEGTINEIYRQIAEKLTGFAADIPDAKGKIDTGPGVPHGYVVKVLDLYHGAKYKTIVFTGLTVNTNLTKGLEWWNKIRKKLAE